jgi:hypothetical protein
MSLSSGAVPVLRLLGFSLCCGVLGCSLIRDFGVEQCRTDGDCSQFGDYSCSAQNVCVERMTNTSGAGSGGGKGGSAGSESNGGSEPDPAMGGTPIVAECKTNKDCIDAHEGEPYVCREDACVPLTLQEHCPYVIAGTEDNPTEYLTRPGKPIIFGAYVPIDASNPEGHAYTLNYRFALEEFMQGTLGGVGTPARPFVMVLCQSTKPDLTASVAHLVDTVQVPAILASLPSADLAAVFNDVSTRERKVFLLGPFEADSTLTALDDGGRIWHMLGPVTDLVPTYVPLFQLAEEYVHRQIKKVQPRPPLKVAVINTDLTYSLDLANALPSKVSINGQLLNAKENKDYYHRIQVKAVGKTEPDTSGVIGELSAAGSADIVVSLGGGEFIEPVLTAIQSARTTADTPFYILSPRHAFDERLSSTAYYASNKNGMGMTFVDKVSAGVNYASVEDSSLYDQYLENIQARFPGEDGLESRENLYDAAYFMLYSLAAASFTVDTADASIDFDGDDVANGMKALVNGSKAATVGLGDDGEMIISVLTTLRTGGKVKLSGTLGPPDFNPLTGARNSPGSVWCISRPGAVPTVKFDMLRLDPEMPKQLKLSGSAFCYDQFFPLP